jgi:hypothetical protein
MMAEHGSTSPLWNDAKRNEDWWKDELYFMDNRSVSDSLWRHNTWEAKQGAENSYAAISLAKSFPGSLTFVTTCELLALADDHPFSERWTDGYTSLKLMNDTDDRIGDTMKVEAA